MSSELISTAKPAFQKYPLFSWTNFVGLLPWIYFLPTLMLDIFIVTVIIRTFKTPFTSCWPARLYGMPSLGLPIT
uniref:Uncharacterized protein n=1 Tax=Ditylenchus dipsaci TaxID=166011 RepID=A0A915D376_9BILA